jgi:hypothetical protein
MRRKKSDHVGNPEAEAMTESLPQRGPLAVLSPSIRSVISLGENIPMY